MSIKANIYFKQELLASLDSFPKSVEHLSRRNIPQLKGQEISCYFLVEGKKCYIGEKDGYLVDHPAFSEMSLPINFFIELKEENSTSGSDLYKPWNDELLRSEYLNEDENSNKPAVKGNKKAKMIDPEHIWSILEKDPNRLKEILQLADMNGKNNGFPIKKTAVASSGNPIISSDEKPSDFSFNCFNCSLPNQSLPFSVCIICTNQIVCQKCEAEYTTNHEHPSLTVRNEGQLKIFINSKLTVQNLDIKHEEWKEEYSEEIEEFKQDPGEKAKNTKKLDDKGFLSNESLIEGKANTLRSINKNNNKKFSHPLNYLTRFEKEMSPDFSSKKEPVESFELTDIFDHYEIPLLNEHNSLITTDIKSFIILIYLNNSSKQELRSLILQNEKRGIEIELPAMKIGEQANVKIEVPLLGKVGEFTENFQIVSKEEAIKSSQFSVTYEVFPFESNTESLNYSRKIESGCDPIVLRKTQSLMEATGHKKIKNCYRFMMSNSHRDLDELTNYVLENPDLIHHYDEEDENDHD